MRVLGTCVRVQKAVILQREKLNINSTIMRKCCIFLMLLFASVMVQAKGNGISSEIFKNGKVKYEKSTNTLVLEDGFMFSLGKGLVVFETGKDLHILLKGNAEFKAALVFKDNLIIEAAQPAKRVRITPEVQK